MSDPVSTSGRDDDYASIAERLFALRPRGTKYGIDRMRLFADELGHPERALPVIHIAGTNGKGSVAAMIEAILRAAGWRVGLYTSPHLVHVGERVRVNRARLTTGEIAAYFRELDPLADRVAQRAGRDDRPSFFEYLTAMALLHFSRAECDIAVLETGLGGEFDATNIVTPEVSVITSIGFDHSEWLGDSLTSIARAKAGIIKPQRPVVIGRLPAEAEEVIRQRATQCAAPVISVRAHFGEAMAAYPRTNLAGDYQRWNAATATLAVRALAEHWKMADPVIAQGLANVVWSGRWERTRVGERNVILDASHNPEGASVLEHNLAALRRECGRRPIVVVGVLGVERAAPLLATIARHASEIVLVVPDQPRASAYGELEQLIPKDFSGAIQRSTVSEVFPSENQCAIGTKDDVVVVTGSIYLLGEVMTCLRLSP